MTRIERVRQESDLPRALEHLGLTEPVPVVVVVGSASGLSEAQSEAITPLVEITIVPLCEELGAALVDGGTDSGVMGVAGRAYERARATFPLVGVAALGTIAGSDAAVPDPAELEPNHTHVLLVPGGAWGDESPWIVRVARTLTRGGPVAGVLLGGGAISARDVENLVNAHAPVFVVAGSGRLADALGGSVSSGDPRERALRESPLVVPVRAIEDRSVLETALRHTLT